MLNNKFLRTLTIALVLVMIISLVGCKKNEDENSTANVTETSEMRTVVDEQAAPNAQTESAKNKEQADTQDTDKPETDGGGNENNNSSTTKVYEYNVLVSEDTYYYNNAPITLDELISEISDGEGEKLVIITDNNATRNAYKDLTDKLNELEIPFEEK